MCITKKNTAVTKKGTVVPRRASCCQKAKVSPYRRPQKKVTDVSEVKKTKKKVSFAFPVCSQVHIIEPHISGTTKSNDPVDADVTELTAAMGRLEIGDPMETLIEAMSQLQLGDECAPMEIDDKAQTPANSGMEDGTVPMQIDWYEPVPMEIDWYEPVPMEIDWYEPVPMEIDYYEPVPMEIEWYEPTPMEIDG